MAVSITTTEDAVFESVVGNSTEGDPIEDEPAEGDPPVGEPNEGEPAMGEPAVDDVDAAEQSDLDDSENDDDSDLDEIEEADFEKSNDKVSDLNEPCSFGENYSRLFKGDPYKYIRDNYTEEETDTDEPYEEKLKNIVNYTDKCNSDQQYIVQIHTKSMYDLEPLPEEPSAIQLGRFTDKVVLHMWVLQKLDLQYMDQWSGIFINLISTKLDSTTRNLWNTFAWKISKDEHNVTLSSLLKFLQSTC